MQRLLLNELLEPDLNGRLRLERHEGQLHGWWLNREGEWHHLNPFTFGLGFQFRTLENADFSYLETFLNEDRPERSPYEVPFPVGQQTEIMERFLMEEHNAQLSLRKREIFCDLYEQLYPVFWRYALTSGACILYDGFYGRYLSESYMPYQSSSTYEELIEAVFGEVRKDTMREGRNVDALGLALAYLFRGLLPLDLIMQELATQEGHFGEFPLEEQSFAALQRLSAPIRRRLFVDLIIDYKLDAQFVQDALDLLEVIPAERLHRMKGVKNWNQLHRRLMSYCDVVEGDERIQLHEAFNRLREPLEGITFKPLSKASEFVEVGDWLDICIGKAGYFMRALRGESYCLVGYDDAQPYCALELKFVAGQWKVNQLRREHNEWLPNQKLMIEKIEERLNRE